MDSSSPSRTNLVVVLPESMPSQARTVWPARSSAGFQAGEGVAALKLLPLRLVLEEGGPPLPAPGVLLDLLKAVQHPLRLHLGVPPAYRVSRDRAAP